MPEDVSLEDRIAAVAAGESDPEGAGSSPEAGDSRDPDAASDPSPDTGETYDREELLKVVQEAADEARPKTDPKQDQADAGETDSPPESEQDQDLSEVEAEQKAAEGEAKPPDDYSDVPFNKHPRFKQLLGELHGLRGDNETLKAGADQWGKISTFMDHHKLTDDTTGRMFQAAAGVGDPAMKELCDYTDHIVAGRFDDALAMARKQVEELETLSGHSLSQDLQRRVDEGLVDEATALELSKATSRSQVQERMHERQLAQRDADDRARSVKAMQGAVSDFEREKQAKDPDYARIQPFVRDRLRVLKAEKEPATPQDAAALAKQAYDDVIKQLTPLNGGKTVSKRSVAGGESMRTPAPEPKTAYEAARQALDTMNG